MGRLMAKPAEPGDAPPAEPPLGQACTRELLPMRLTDPLRWLRAGWSDLMAAPGIAFFYGACFWIMALVVGVVFRNMPEYTVSFISGCFLIGPFLAMGLYEVSRRRERGLAQSLGASLTCWSGHLGSMGMLLLVLLLLELLWGRASLVVFAVFFNTAMPTTAGMLQALLDPKNWQFVAVYLAVGGIFAGLVFSTCVVSLPMILDRDTDAITAGLASIQVVALRTGTMFVWGALIVALVLGALMLPWAIGLLLVGPWLGHASWHAYRGSFAWHARQAQLAT
jgi:uncharacterized membrane protein